MNAAHTGRALLLASLNAAAAAQGITFTPDDLVFLTPVPSTNPNREVQVTYQASPSSLFEGEAVAFYDRLDLTALFEGAGIDLIEVVKGFPTTTELVEHLNTRFGMGFNLDDFMIGTVINEEDTEVVLEALPGSFAFKGQLLISLVVAKTPLADAVVNPELGGLQVTPVDSEAEPA
ncbi:hypothetical protein D3C87_957900 [compost metagenome]